MVAGGWVAPKAQPFETLIALRVISDNPDVYYLTIRELSERVHAQQIAPLEIVDACLARIEQLNPRLNAFITVLADEARERAKERGEEIRAGRWRGPLDGIPVGIKDFFDTANVRTTAAFEKFKDRIPAKDAEAVARLKEAGAIVIGKTNMHQLGMGTTGLDSYFGPVRNPWNDAHIPGGSSSGSAAAVATGMCYATLDTDAIGSCRLPAACCGVVGFKGTYGLISAKGILDGEKADDVILWLSHPAITTRSAVDTAIVLDATTERRGQQAAPLRLRIGVADRFKAAPEIAATFEAAVARIRTFGHEMRAADAPIDTPPFGDVHAIETDRQTIADRSFRDIDVVVLPTTATTVPSVKDATGNPQALSAESTMFANYFGLPAISVPTGFDGRGLPIGLQIVGKPWDEATVLALAHQFEIASGLRDKHPIP